MRINKITFHSYQDLPLALNFTHIRRRAFYYLFGSIGTRAVACLPRTALGCRKDIALLWICMYFEPKHTFRVHALVRFCLL